MLRVISAIPNTSQLYYFTKNTRYLQDSPSCEPIFTDFVSVYCKTKIGTNDVQPQVAFKSRGQRSRNDLHMA